METDFHLICEDSSQFDFLLGWTPFKELSMRNACDTAPLRLTRTWKPYHIPVSQWYVYPRTHIPSDMCIPGGDTISKGVPPSRPWSNWTMR